MLLCSKWTAKICNIWNKSRIWPPLTINCNKENGKSQNFKASECLECRACASIFLSRILTSICSLVYIFSIQGTFESAAKSVIYRLAYFVLRSLLKVLLGHSFWFMFIFCILLWGQNGRKTVNAMCLFPFFFQYLKERILGPLFRYLLVISLHLFSGNTVWTCNLCNLKNNEDLKDCSTFKVKIRWSYFFFLEKRGKDIENEGRFYLSSPLIFFFIEKKSLTTSFSFLSHEERLTTKSHHLKGIVSYLRSHKRQSRQHTFMAIHTLKRRVG